MDVQVANAAAGKSVQLHGWTFLLLVHVNTDQQLRGELLNAARFLSALAGFIAR